MSELRLIAMGEEEVEHLRLLADWFDATRPNENDEVQRDLRSIADRYEDGITKEDVRALAGVSAKRRVKDVMPKLDAAFTHPHNPNRRNK